MAPNPLFYVTVLATLCIKGFSISPLTQSVNQSINQSISHSHSEIMLTL